MNEAKESIDNSSEALAFECLFPKRRYSQLPTLRFPLYYRLYQATKKKTLT